MAKLILTNADQDKQITLTAGPAWEVFGTDGVDTIVVQPGATTEITSGGGEDIIKLGGNPADYKIYREGALSTKIIVEDKNTGAKVTLPASTEGDKLQFASGDPVVVKIDTANGFNIKVGDTVLEVGADNAVEAADVVPNGVVPTTYTVTADTSTVQEGNAVTFTVTASKAADEDMTFNYQVKGDDKGGVVNAADSADFTAITGTVTLPAGETSATFTVTPKDDQTTEGFEGFKVELLDSNFNAVATSPVVVINDAPVQPQPKTFTLTAGTDAGADFIGGPKDDTFNATLIGDAAQGTTIQPGDTLKGGDGNDKLVLTVTGDSGADGYTVAGVSTDSIETLQISNFDTGAGATTIDAALMSGLKNVVLYASSGNGDTTVTNLQNLVDAEMRNGSADLSLQFTDSAVSGTDDTVNLTVSNVTDGNFLADNDLTTNNDDGKGVENINIKSELVASTLNAVISDTLKKLTITGDKDLTINTTVEFGQGNAGTTLDGEIDASSFTGNLKINAGNGEGRVGDQTVKVTGGSGDDVIDMENDLTKNDIINGGDGNDTVKISIGNTGDAAAAAQDFADYQLTSIETMEMAINDTNGGTNIDVKALDDAMTIALVAGTDDTDATVNNLANAQLVTITNDSADGKELGDVALNLESDTATDDQVKVKLIAKTDANQTLDKLTVDSGAEQLDIEVTGASGDNTYTLTSLIADGAKTINITGDGNFEFTLNETGTNATTTIDASNATGTMNITENVANDITIKGSSGQNTFNIQVQDSLNNKDTLIGGASDKDKVTATVGDGLDATTGKLNLTDIEELELTVVDGGAPTVDLSASTGVNKVTVIASGATGDGDLTLKGLAAGTKIATTDQATNDFDGTISVSLADDTGTSDELTVELNNDQTADNFTLNGTGIETLTLAAATTGIYNGTGVNVSGFEANTIKITGGDAASKIDLTEGASNLNKSVTSVDASNFAGDLTITASADAAAPGITINAGELGVATDTGAFNDSITATTAADQTDKLIAVLGTNATAADFATAFNNFEEYELTFKDGISIKTAANEGIGDGDNTVKSIVIKGGNTLSSFTSTNGAMDSTALTTFDASDFNGKVSINVDAGIADNFTTLAGAKSAEDTLIFSSVNGLDAATTGKLTTTGFETVSLRTTTNASSIDAAGLTGVKTIAVQGDQDVTLSNVAAGTIIQLGESNDATYDDYSGKLTVSLADETGANDELTINLVESAADDQIDATLVTTGIETVTIKHNAVSTKGDADLDVSALKATTLVLTGGLAGESLDLTSATSETLSASTTTLDATSFDSDLKAIAEANTATTFKAKGANVDLTGGNANDVFVVGKSGGEIGAAITTIEGGSGTDSLTVYAKASASLANVNAVENITIHAAATGADYTITTFATGKGGNDAETITIDGGETGKLITLSGDIADHKMTLDASNLQGSIKATFGANELVQTNILDAIVIKGGQSDKDEITASYTNDAQSDTGQFTMSGVETFKVKTTNAGSTAGADTVDLTNVTGLKNLVLATGTTNANSVTVTALKAGTEVTLGDGSLGEFAGVTAKVDLADTTGTADSLTVNLVDTNNAGSTATIQTDGVESLTLALVDSIEDHKVSLSNTNDNAATLTVTGANTAADLTVASLASSYSTIDAAGLKGSFTMATGARTNTSAMTITTGEGDDAIHMMNGNDTIDMGANADNATDATKGDTLYVNYTAVLGGIGVDLSSTTDQITTFDGAANAAVQKGFEHIDLSGYNGSFGASITGSDAANTIVGTANADIINAGKAGDVITGGGGNDSIDLGAGDEAVDAVIYNGPATAADGVDTIKGFKGGAANGDFIAYVADAATDFKSGNGTSIDLTSYTGADRVDSTSKYMLEADNLDFTAATGYDSAKNVIFEVASSKGTISDNNSDGKIDAADFVAIFGSGGRSAITFSGTNDTGAGVVIVYDGTTAAADAYMFYVDISTSNDTAATIGANDTVKLIGVLQDVGADTLTDANFA